MSLNIKILKDSTGMEIKTAKRTYFAIQRKGGLYELYVKANRNIKPIEQLGKAKYMTEVCEMINKYEMEEC